MSIKINLGYEVRDFEKGILVENLPLRQFKYHILISGNDSREKSAVLSHILNQIYVKAPDIGVLFVKLRSNEDTYLYHLNKVYEYGEPELEIPYFLEHAYSDVNREQLINCLNAMFGFHYEMKWVMRIIIKHYKLGRFPNSLVDFLEDLKNCLMEYPYDKHFTESNIKSIEKAIEFIQEDSLLERALWIPSGLPEWLKLWSEGKKVCIDLSSCDSQIQKLLVVLLCQILKNFVPTNESNIPSGIVVLEDADHILEEPPHDYYRKTYNSNRDYYGWKREKNYFLTKEQIEGAYEDPNYLFNIQFESVFRDLIVNEFRYRNISLFTVFVDTLKIYKFLNSSSKIKVLLG